MEVIEIENYNKRFPATIEQDNLTFLNDRKINGELYAIFQELSYAFQKEGKQYMTYVDKSKVPTQAELCRKLGIKSPKTLRNYLNYLLEKEYIKDCGDKYLLPEQESIYFLIPLKTLTYLNDNCREHIIKIYIYLGQRYKYAEKLGKQYEFSSKELGEHIGIKVKDSSRGYEIINNALLLLENSGLIEYCEYFDGVAKKKKLLSFSFDVKGK